MFAFKTRVFEKSCESEGFSKADKPRIATRSQKRKNNAATWKERKIQSRNPHGSLAHFEQKSVLRTIRASEEAYFGRRLLFLSQANPRVCQLVLGTKANAGEPPANLITARGLLQLQQSGKKHNPAAEQGIISLCARRCSPEWRAPLLPPYRSPTLLLPLLHHLYLFTTHPLQQPPRRTFSFTYTRAKSRRVSLRCNTM